MPTPFWKSKPLRRGTADRVAAAPDTIDVTIQDQARGNFATVYGSHNSSVTIAAESKAQAGLVTQAQGAVPIVVGKTQPMLTACSGVRAATRR